MRVYKYIVLYSFTLLDELFLKGDELFIQQGNPNHKASRKVYSVDKVLLGVITDDVVHKLNNVLLKLKEDE